MRNGLVAPASTSFLMTGHVLELVFSRVSLGVRKFGEPVCRGEIQIVDNDMRMCFAVV